MERFTLPPVISASQWTTLAESVLKPTARGAVTDGEGSAPAWTNREAAALVSALREAARAVGWPLWYQFAAIAYGWTPESDELIRTSEQADAPYSAYAAVQLAGELRRLAGELDRGGVKWPALQVSDVWSEVPWLQELTVALRDDGAEALWKVPLPACKDPRTGKPARPVKDPGTGKWTCPAGPVLIDDPITAIIKALAPLVPIALAIVAVAVVVKKPRRDRRKG